MRLRNCRTELENTMAGEDVEIAKYIVSNYKMLHVDVGIARCVVWL